MPLSPLRAPFPWFGGKSRAAHLIWERFGDVANYIEPFAGSLAVLLSRPTAPRIETVNDLDCNVANFWRATKADPEAVAKWADWPVNEADLHARHRWLVENLPAHREKMMRNPDYFDAKIAGWWVWGLCQWIGTGWCVERGSSSLPIQIPHLGDAGMGIHRKIPHLGNAGRGGLVTVFADLARRLRSVRVACGDWARVVTPAVTERHGVTGILLDPPYQEGNMGYATGEDRTVSAAVATWARENGENQLLRIALCGLEGEHTMPPDWDCVPWICRKGYAGADNDNRKRERIWFSPACLRPDKGQLALLEPGPCPTP